MKALLAIDGSHEFAMAIETAASLTWPPDSRLEVISVAPPETEVYGGVFAVGAYVEAPEVHERLVDDCRKRVDAAAERLRRPGLAVAERVLGGRAATVILEEAERTSAELIIVGARDHGAIERVLLGSVSAEVVDHAHCPVLVARRPTAWRVLVATDGSPDAALGAGFVATSGLFDAAGARIVNVIDVPVAWWLGFTPGDGTLATDAYGTVVTDATGHARSVAADAVRRLRCRGDGGPVGPPRGSGVGRDHRRGRVLGRRPGRHRDTRPRAAQAPAPGQHRPDGAAPRPHVGPDRPAEREQSGR